VYPKEALEFPDAKEAIDVALRDLAKYGPAPDGHAFKPLGEKKGNLWQINIRVLGRQIRILYSPYGDVIVIFRIHKKSSPQEQQREYELAMKRKREAERIVGTSAGYHGLPTFH
jgi:hypothetical protein